MKLFQSISGAMSVFSLMFCYFTQFSLVVGSLGVPHDPKGLQSASMRPGRNHLACFDFQSFKYQFVIG